MTRAAVVWKETQAVRSYNVVYGRRWALLGQKKRSKGPTLIQ